VRNVEKQTQLLYHAKNTVRRQIRYFYERSVNQSVGARLKEMVLRLKELAGSGPDGTPEVKA